MQTLAKRTSRALVLGLALLVPACSDGGGGSGSQAASKLPADTAVAWFDLLYDTIQSQALSPPVASRIIGYSGVAAYESVVPGMKGFRSLGGQLNDLAALPELPSGKHHWPAVLNEALSEVIVGLLDAPSQQTLDAVAALHDQLEADFAADASPEELERSSERGAAVAAHVLAWAMEDGYSTYANCAYTPPTGAGLWVPTPPAMAPALQPCWGELRPFVLLYAAECFVLAPPAFSEDTGSAFYAEALEVYDTVNNLTQDQLDIAQFWADNPGATGTPPGHWISIVGQILAANDLTLEDAAQAYARVGIAVADAFISCWEMKYIYNYLRPITFIHSATGINDPAWVTATGVGTPPFPEYTSGHSVQSGAASYVLEDLWGTVAFDDDTHAGTFPMRSFPSFRAAAEEAALSRLYGGIHFRAAIDRGVDQGRCVGKVLVDEVRFREE